MLQRLTDEDFSLIQRALLAKQAAHCLHRDHRLPMLLAKYSSAAIKGFAQQRFRLDKLAPIKQQVSQVAHRGQRGRIVVSEDATRTLQGLTVKNLRLVKFSLFL